MGYLLSAEGTQMSRIKLDIRSIVFQLRMSEADMSRLDKLAKERGWTRAQVVRELVRNAAKKSDK